MASDTQPRPPGDRRADLVRETTETRVRVALHLDGGGARRVATGIGFFDHMLDQLGRHAMFDLELETNGDLHIDAHHTVEDSGLALGQAISRALGDRRGIMRYGDCLLPMDETLARVAVDLSGRPHLAWHVPFTQARLGDMDTELFREFFQALAQAGGITLHVAIVEGRNNHHMIEAAFKGVARALRQAVALDPGGAGALPSTKGTLTG